MPFVFSVPSSFEPSQSATLYTLGAIARNGPACSNGGMPTDIHAAINNVVWIDKGRMSGEPCFRDTRVPIQTLLDHLDLDDFLENFPSVSRQQATLFLELAKAALVTQVDESA